MERATFSRGLRPGIDSGIRRVHLRGGGARLDGHGLRVVARPVVDGGKLGRRDGLRRGLRVVLHRARRGSTRARGGGGGGGGGIKMQRVPLPESRSLGFYECGLALDV